MFLVYLAPKIFSFFLVPIYTSFLTPKEYGISDLIATTASLIIPFISLATPNAIMRFTIENKNDKRPFQIALKISSIGFLVLSLCLIGVYFVFNIDKTFLIFLFLTIFLSILTDINLSYTRGIEKMYAVTICGIGGTLSGLVFNILFIVVFKWALVGFLLASISGYIFQIISLSIMNYNLHLYKGIFNDDKTLTKDILSFSIPLIFSGISWWIVSSSDRYFVTFMCGAAMNGIYSIAYRIPLIVQTVDNVFGQAWIYSVYDSYKTDEGKKYIYKINGLYIFIICLIGSILISFDITLSKFLYVKDFFSAWNIVPFLVIAAVFSACGGLMSIYISIYKKTKSAMFINISASLLNVVLNYILIKILNNPVGAAIATSITFFMTWLSYTILGGRLSGINTNFAKCLFTFFILILQIIIITIFQNEILASFGILIIIIINIKNIKILFEKLKNKLITVFF